MLSNKMSRKAAKARKMPRYHKWTLKARMKHYMKLCASSKGSDFSYFIIVARNNFNIIKAYR